jgi:hypothetical protein
MGDTGIPNIVVGIVSAAVVGVFVVVAVILGSILSP